jgi:hypothetical protein
MSEQDKAAANAGKTVTDTAGVAGKDGGKGPATEPTDAERAAMKAKAVAAAAAKG